VRRQKKKDKEQTEETIKLKCLDFVFKRISYSNLRDGIANRARGAEGIRARPEGEGVGQGKREA
jgi:hypothetical protein